VVGVESAQKKYVNSMIPLSHFFLLSGTLVTLVGTGGGGKRGENEVRRHERQEPESRGTHLK
jgi:hypothetical protein